MKGCYCIFLIFSDIKDNKNLVEQTVLVLRHQSLQFILFSQTDAAELSNAACLIGNCLKLLEIWRVVERHRETDEQEVMRVFQS